MSKQPPISPAPNILTTKELPSPRRVAVLPVRDTVLFPHAVLPLTVGRESSIQLIESLGEERSIVVVAQLDPRLDAPAELAPIFIGIGWESVFGPIGARNVELDREDHRALRIRNW